MKIRVALIFMVILAVQGCAAMNEQECVTGDWYAIGFEDGTQGRRADRIGTYRKACAEHQVTPDLQAYQEGRDDGLREFCQPQVGFNFGKRGGSYSGVCPVELEEDFFAAYQDGKQLYQLRSQISYASSQIEYRETELHDLEEELALITVALIKDEASTEEKAVLLVDAKNMAKRQGKLKKEILDLEKDRAVYQDRLASYLQTIAYDY